MTAGPVRKVLDFIGITRPPDSRGTPWFVLLCVGLVGVVLAVVSLLADRPMWVTTVLALGGALVAVLGVRARATDRRRW